jgi:surface antigen
MPKSMTKTAITKTTMTKTAMTKTKYWLLVLACVTAVPAYAQTYQGYAERSILGTLSTQELRSVETAAIGVLDHAPDGKATKWTSPTESDRATIVGTLEPLRTRKDQGESCRLLKSTLVRQGETEAWSFWFCKNAEGNWKSRPVGQR